MEISPLKTLGIISDTHGYFDEKITGLFAGVDHILHAGDFGSYDVILRLEQIAPVTAVMGNVDAAGFGPRESEVFVVAGRSLLIHHIVDPRRPSEILARLLDRHHPDIVVFGHTHRSHCETLDGTLYLNPGYSGRPRGNEPRSVGILKLGETAPDFLRCRL